MVLRLLVRTIREPEKEFIFHPGDEVLIGRYEGAAISLPYDREVSTRHLKLHYDSTRWRLQDLGSTNGTRVNGQSLRDTDLANGDIIALGSTELAVRVMPTSSNGTPQLVEERIDIQSPESLYAILSKEPSLYALLDAARDPLVLGYLYQCTERYQSLYEGNTAIEMAEYSPYLVRLPIGCSLLPQLLDAGWLNSWVVFLSSIESFDTVRRHFRKFLRVRLPTSEIVYVRFYDPRVLHSFLTTLEGTELMDFCAVTKDFWLPGESLDAAWTSEIKHFSRY